MLKYLIVQLDDTSVSFCHYSRRRSEANLMGLNVLKDILVWSMKENVTVQFLCPDYELPQEHKSLIESVNHTDIVSSRCEDDKLLRQAAIVVFDSWESLSGFSFDGKQAYVLRTRFEELFDNISQLDSVLPKVSRLNVVITNLAELSAEHQKLYQKCLGRLNEKIVQEYQKRHEVQVNILTDRIMLESMNNCGAGDTSITVAPNGRFYICPAFYLDNDSSVGDIYRGPDIKNSNLYKLSHAPICRICDAWQCKRCVWLNRRFTLEVNTPGKEQCVAAHIERNASKELLNMLHQCDIATDANEIPDINYLDPLDKLLKKV